MHQRMAAEAFAQPQAEGDQRVPRRQFRVVIVGAAVFGAAAVGGERHGDVAEAGGAEGEGLLTMALDVAPLCPAGHLPHMGGDWQLRRRLLSLPTSMIGEVADDGAISPLVGEMSGRTEGGDVERDACELSQPPPTPPPPPPSHPPAARPPARDTPRRPSPHRRARAGPAARAAIAESLQPHSPPSSGRAAWR